jgi:hypothetical protein
MLHQRVLCDYVTACIEKSLAAARFKDLSLLNYTSIQLVPGFSAMKIIIKVTHLYLKCIIVNKTIRSCESLKRRRTETVMKTMADSTCHMKIHTCKTCKASLLCVSNP